MPELSLDNLQQIGWTLLAAVIAVGGSYLLVLARKLARGLSEKLGLQSSNELEALLVELVSQGISYAEQEAKRQAKITNGSIDNEFKLDMATRFIISQISKTPSIPDMSASDVQNKIEAVLGLQNMAKSQGGDDAEGIIP